MAEPVRMRRLTDQEGQKLQQIVRRGSTNSVRYRRAMMLLASPGGNRVPVIAQLVQADEDTVRDVIHRFNETRWDGSRAGRTRRRRRPGPGSGPGPLDPVQLRVSLGGGGFLPRLGALEGDTAAGEQRSATTPCRRRRRKA